LVIKESTSQPDPVPPKEVLVPTWKGDYIRKRRNIIQEPLGDNVEEHSVDSPSEVPVVVKDEVVACMDEIVN